MTTNVSSQDRTVSNQRPTGALILLGLVILFSLAQLFLGVFVIPRFTVVYRDLFGSHPLPISTTIVLQLRWVLVGFAFIWPLAGVYLLRQRPYLVSILGVLILSIAFFTIALFVPLAGTIIRSAPPVQSEELLPDPIEQR